MKLLAGLHLVVDIDFVGVVVGPVGKEVSSEHAVERFAVVTAEVVVSR